MGVRLSEMKAKVKESQITWDDQTVDFAYKPNEFTMELADQIDAAAKSESTDIVSLLLAPIIVWWDVLDDKDKRIPVTPDTMGQFPLNFLLALMRQITADQDPERKG